MNKLRRLAVAALAALALTAGAAAPATAAPATAAPATAAPSSPRAAERQAALWAPNYLMGEVRTWSCASKGTRTCGVYSKTKRAHYLVTFDAAGDVSSIVPRRASVRDA